MFSLFSLVVLGLLLFLLEIASRDRMKDFIWNLIGAEHDRLESERGSHAVAVDASGTRDASRATDMKEVRMKMRRRRGMPVD